MLVPPHQKSLLICSYSLLKCTSSIPNEKKQHVEAAAVVLKLGPALPMTSSRAASRSARRNGGGGPQAARLAMEGLRARKRLALRRCKHAGVKSDSTQAEVGR